MEDTRTIAGQYSAKSDLPLDPRGKADALLERYMSYVACGVVWGWSDAKIMTVLVQECGVSPSEISLSAISRFRDRPELKSFIDAIALKNTVAVQNFWQASEMALDTSAERIQLAAILKDRIQRRYAKELQDGSFQRELRNDIKEFAALLASEDRKKSLMPTTIEGSSGIGSLEDWPDEDPHVEQE